MRHRLVGRSLFSNREIPRTNFQLPLVLSHKKTVSHSKTQRLVPPACAARRPRRKRILATAYECENIMQQKRLRGSRAFRSNIYAGDVECSRFRKGKLFEIENLSGRFLV